jgi:hypothetical protein
LSLFRRGNRVAVRSFPHFDPVLREGQGGVWSGEDVRPGKYIINFAVIAPTETPGPNRPLLSATKEVTIPEQAEERIDFGVIALGAAEM